MSEFSELMLIPVIYRNWRGETAQRRFIPISIWWGTTKWHPEQQWFLRARDVDQSDYRDFALRDCDFRVATLTPAKPVSAATAEQALAADILAELTRARAKFTGKNVTFAALVEEVGELATATFEESADRVRKEAVQVAVMAMRMVLDGDHCFDAWRAEKGLDHLDPASRAASDEVVAR